MLDSIVIETAPDPDAAVVWMHGLGADGNDFADIVPELGLAPLKVRFVFPNAPVMPVTVNGGMPMRAWYDISDPDLGRDPDIAGIRKSASLVAELVRAQELSGIASGRIALAGFSQGGVLALELGPRYEKPLAGILALSTYSPTAHLLGKEASAANQKLPILMAHGTVDPVVPPALAQKAREELEANGRSVDFRTYPMPHAVHPQEIQDIGVFIRSVFSGS
jgi:phospholipase/carboxylesterase